MLEGRRRRGECIRDCSYYDIMIWTAMLIIIICSCFWLVLRMSGLALQHDLVERTSRVRREDQGVYQKWIEEPLKAEIQPNIVLARK